MRWNALSRFRRSHGNGAPRHIPTASADLLAGVAVMVLLLLLTRLVAMATNGLVELFGG